MTGNRDWVSFDSYRLNLNLNILFPRNQLNYVIEEIKNPERWETRKRQAVDNITIVLNILLHVFL